MHSFDPPASIEGTDTFSLDQERNSGRVVFSQHKLRRRLAKMVLVGCIP